MQFLERGAQRSFCEARGTGRFILTHEEFGDLVGQQVEVPVDDGIILDLEVERKDSTVEIHLGSPNGLELKPLEDAVTQKE